MPQGEDRDRSDLGTGFAGLVRASVSFKQWLVLTQHETSVRGTLTATEFILLRGMLGPDFVTTSIQISVLPWRVFVGWAGLGLSLGPGPLSTGNKAQWAGGRRWPQP